MTSAEQMIEPQYTPTVNYKMNTSGGISPEVDLETGGTAFINIDTARNTEVVPLTAALHPTGKTFWMKALTITNREAFDLRIDIFNATGGAAANLVFSIMVPAGASVGADKNSLIGKYFTAGIFWMSQGNAWVSGVTVDIGGFYLDT